MKSHYCPECVVAWYPYQAKESCPECGGGVEFRQEPASPEAVARYQATRPEWMARYFPPEPRQDTEPIDSQGLSLELLWDLPAVEPKRDAA